MTAPEMEEAWPQLFRAGARALVENAKRLGLTWNLRMATVTDATTSGQVEVRMDGDLASISVTSMVGTVALGDRVYVITIPPAGNYIVGLARGFTPLQLIYNDVIESTNFITLTTVATLIPGLTFTASTLGDFEYDVLGIFDFEQAATALNAVCIGELFINGVVVGARNALFEVGTAADRATVSQQWHGTGTNGDLFELYARKSAAVGTLNARSPHSSMGIRLWQ